MAKTRKMIYFFGGGKAEGRAEMKALLGGKGANLAEMSALGLPVPPGFTITTEVCDLYNKRDKTYPPGLDREIDANIARLERLTGKTFGRGPNPLLVSVRSGAAASMPGMMDTVLNLGLNDETIRALIDLTKNERFAWDAYRRFMQMFGDVVLGIEHDAFEHALDGVKKRRGAKLDTDLCLEGLKEVVRAYQEVYRAHEKAFPQEARRQLDLSIDAVFGSWDNPRAVKYRALNDIKGLLGTAVNVQTMVFGNMGETSGTGAAFTRNPSTGENKFYGEYLMNAQGEDVVAGIRTPQPISHLAQVDPKSYRQLVGIRKKLETHYRDMQDVEFTIELGTLYMLQTRNGKRTAAAAVKNAVDMVREKLITEKEALLRVEPQMLDQLLHPVFDAQAEKKAVVLATGLPASPGAATGQVVFSADEAEAWAAEGKQVILCRTDTSPEDSGGMDKAQGILTARGGMTSHAAVVARGMGKCCVAGCPGVQMDYRLKTLRAGEVTIKEGDWISLNGSTGTVYLGRIATVEPQLSGPFGILMKWADQYRRLGVRANSDTPHDTEVAVRFGAEGIGLTRTEHMFFEGDRIVSFRRLILVAETVKKLKDDCGVADLDALTKDCQADPKAIAAIRQYQQALAELLPLQRADFAGIFRALKGRPCTIRLLDPPLHEFLPHDAEGQEEMARTMGVEASAIKALVEGLHEFNPMLGHRGCRLGITYPEVTAMQVRAIIEAAIEVRGSRPEIMIPLVGHVKELSDQKRVALDTIETVKKERGVKRLDVFIGTMIEVPRAAVTADEVAREAEFFSFGTNDLTQMGSGFSRDDAGKFLGEYVAKGIYEYDPFQVIDAPGVGRLMEIGVSLGRKTRKNLKIGICGEHGGEPKSVAFCHKAGLDYVSCSPYRVPIARLAAAQAAIRDASGRKAGKKPLKKAATRKKAAAKKAVTKKGRR
ncbi:MAG: pyruvate, phosphate dikinase [Planctomycetota bacterium]